MQPGPTAAGFLDLVEASRLVGPEQLAVYRAHAGAAVTPGAVASRLVRDRLLTPFQAKVLLRGRADGFFFTDKYKILDHIGTGGMGRVYLCEHLLLNRLVAVKVLGASPGSPPPTRGVVERFYREARAVAALDHRNIVRVFDVDQARGAPFMVMEYVDGIDLHRYVTARGPLDPARAADYVRQAADGLQHAHEHGLVHRDVKPSNLLLDRAGLVRLLDLGLARFLVDARRNQGVTERFDPNVVLGTADFMAPEQAVDSSRVDIRADIYGLGCTLYFLLTGKLVFEADTFAQKMIYHQMRKPAPVREHRPEVPGALDEIAARMMAKEPADRYQTPGEVSAALAVLAVPPPAPPDSGLMPRVAAGDFRLGLSPSPGSGVESSADPTPRLPRPPSRATPADSPETTSEPGPDTPPSAVGGRPAHSAPDAARAADPAPVRPRSRRWWFAGGAAVAAVAVLAVVFRPAADPAPPPDPAPPAPRPDSAKGTAPDPVPAKTTVTGGGSSFVAPIMEHWTERYRKDRGVAVRYESLGSSRGVQGLIDGTLGFGCTDAPMTAEQVKKLREKGRAAVHVPVVLGAVVPIYKLPDLGPEKLKFTGAVLAGIFLGEITHWDDEAIEANNPGLKGKLPHLGIAVVHRADGSGTTDIWTDYLSAVSPEWKAKVGRGAKVTWPRGKGAEKSEGVTDAVNATVGAIGYVELSHALRHNLRYGLVKNRRGAVVEPTFENVTAAAASLGNDVPDDLVFSLVDRRDDAAYPITGATWALLPIPKGGKPDAEVLKFIEWATHDGQRYATDLRYAPLPKNISSKIDALFYNLTR